MRMVMQKGMMLGLALAMALTARADVFQGRVVDAKNTLKNQAIHAIEYLVINTNRHFNTAHCFTSIVFYFIIPAKVLL